MALGTLLLCAAQALASPAPTTATLRVAYVGDLDSPRAVDFTNFLLERFGEASGFERELLGPEARAELAEFDVVLLDWDQESGVLQWFQNRDLVLEHPLGPRESWHTPTVLLGSAGLNTAAAWDVRGGSG